MFPCFRSNVIGFNCCKKSYNFSTTRIKQPIWYAQVHNTSGSVHTEAIFPLDIYFDFEILFITLF